MGRYRRPSGQLFTAGLMEISGAHDTDALAQEIRRRFPDRRILAYPDASGAARSARFQPHRSSRSSRSCRFSSLDRRNPILLSRDRGGYCSGCWKAGEETDRRTQVAAHCRRSCDRVPVSRYEPHWSRSEAGTRYAGYDHMNDALGLFGVPPNSRYFAPALVEGLASACRLILPLDRWRCRMWHTMGAG